MTKIKDKAIAFDFDGTLIQGGLDKGIHILYSSWMACYNSVYSALNSVSADKYWKPFPAVKEALKTLYRSYDLYIASGVTEDILQDDVDHHHFNRSLFQGIYGGNRGGGSDKGSILKKIKSLGYEDVLFIGDATKDLEYAVEADVKFFRIKENNDYLRLLSDIREDYFPDEKTMWSYTEEEKNDVRKIALYLLQTGNRNMSYLEMVDFIHI